MKVARKIILAMMAAFLGLLATLAVVEVRRALGDDQSLVVSELTLTGHALRAPLAEVFALPASIERPMPRRPRRPVHVEPLDLSRRRPRNLFSELNNKLELPSLSGGFP
jgi:hypothetical protein